MERVSLVSDKTAHLCLQCLQEFSNKAQLRHHMRMCEGIKAYDKITEEGHEAKVKRNSGLITEENSKMETKKESGSFCVSFIRILKSYPSHQGHNYRSKVFIIFLPDLLDKSSFKCECGEVCNTTEEQGRHSITCKQPGKLITRRRSTSSSATAQV